MRPIKRISGTVGSPRQSTEICVRGAGFAICGDIEGVRNSVRVYQQGKMRIRWKAAVPPDWTRLSARTWTLLSGSVNVLRHGVAEGRIELTGTTLFRVVAILPAVDSRDGRVAGGISEACVTGTGDRTSQQSIDCDQPIGNFCLCCCHNVVSLALRAGTGRTALYSEKPAPPLVPPSQRTSTTW